MLNRICNKKYISIGNDRKMSAQLFLPRGSVYFRAAVIQTKPTQFHQSTIAIDAGDAINVHVSSKDGACRAGGTTACVVEREREEKADHAVGLPVHREPLARRVCSVLERTCSRFWVGVNAIVCARGRDKRRNTPGRVLCRKLFPSIVG